MGRQPFSFKPHTETKIKFMCRPAAPASSLNLMGSARGKIPFITL